MSLNLKVMISIELYLSDNTKLVLSNTCRNPNNSVEGNEHINEFFRNSVKLKRVHQIVHGDFSRKNIDSITGTSTSDRLLAISRNTFSHQREVGVKMSLLFLTFCLLQEMKGWKVLMFMVHAGNQTTQFSKSCTDLQLKSGCLCARVAASARVWLPLLA